MPSERGAVSRSSVIVPPCRMQSRNLRTALPGVPPEAMGLFPAHEMASVAELEAGLIGERIKAALATAAKLGIPNGARALRGKQVGNKEALHRSNVRTEPPCDPHTAGEWHATSVMQLLERLAVTSAPSQPRRA